MLTASCRLVSSRQELAAILQQNRPELRGVVVQWLQHEATAHYLVLASEDDVADPEFLALDVSSDYRRNGRVFYSGEEILASRRRGEYLWAPSPAVEFGCYLVKKIAKGRLADEQGRYLTELYGRDPAGCDREISRFWRGPAAASPHRLRALRDVEHPDAAASGPSERPPAPRQARRRYGP